MICIFSDLAISSAEENSEGDENAAGLLLKAYFRKATLLMDSSPSRSKEALHFFRLCLQIQPGKKSKVLVMETFSSHFCHPPPSIRQ